MVPLDLMMSRARNCAPSELREKIQYRRLVMGLKIAPGHAQSIMVTVLECLDVKVYIENIVICSCNLDEHL